MLLVVHLELPSDFQLPEAESNLKEKARHEELTCTLKLIESTFKERNLRPIH